MTVDSKIKFSLGFDLKESKLLSLKECDNKLNVRIVLRQVIFISMPKKIQKKTTHK